MEPSNNCMKVDEFKRIQGGTLKIGDKNFPIYKGVNTIGRNKVAIVNIKNLNISVHHAIIVIVDDDQHFICDINSSNGTFLAGIKLAPFKLYQLVNNTQVTLGDVAVTYFRCPNMNEAVQLEAENMEKTQNFTQNFYTANTQLLNDSVNDVSPRGFLFGQPHSKFRSGPVPESPNIHEAVTQVVEYSTLVSNAPTEVEPSALLVETIQVDIHNAPTQVVDFSMGNKHYTDLNETTHSIDNAQKQIVNNGASKNQNLNLHELATQIVTYPNRINYGDRHSNDLDAVQPQKLETSGLDVQKCNKEVALETNDPATQIIILENENLPSTSGINYNRKISDSMLNSTKGDKNCDTVIEETLIEDSISEKTDKANIDDSSNDSTDFLNLPQDDLKSGNLAEYHFENFREKPIRKLSSTDEDRDQPECSKSYKSVSDVDTPDIVKPKRKSVRKLSSEEETQGNNINSLCNSDSDTDIEENDKAEKLIEGLNSHKHLEQSKNKQKTCHSDSDTDIEEAKDTEKLNKKDSETEENLIEKGISNMAAGNSDTDAEDEGDKNIESKDQNSPETEDLIKPRVLSKKLTFDSDSEKDVEKQNKQQDQVMRPEHRNSTDLLNDTDCIPATQDAFAEMFRYKDLTQPTNTQNNSSEESFKLGITELMFEDGDKPSEANACSTTSTSKNKNIEQKNEDIFLKKLQKNKGQMTSQQEEDTYVMATQKVDKKTEAQANRQEDVYLMATQKVTEIVLKSAQELSDKQDDLYLMATQKINEAQPEKEEQTSNKQDEEDLYLMATQDLSKKKEDKEEHKFKTPQKKFTFKRKAMNFDSSLSKILGINSENQEDDIYIMATQKTNEPVPSTSNDLDEIYLAATQQLHQDIISKERNFHEDVYMAATQHINMETDEKQKDAVMEAEKEPNLTNITDVFNQQTQKLSTQPICENLKTVEEGPSQLEISFPSQSALVTYEDKNRPSNPLLHVLNRDQATPLKVPEETSIQTDTTYKRLRSANFTLDTHESKKLKKSETQNIKTNNSVVEKQEDQYLHRIPKAKVLPRKGRRNPEGKITDDRDLEVETLSQIDAFVKAPLETVTRSGKTPGGIEVEALNMADQVKTVCQEGPIVEKSLDDLHKIRGSRRHEVSYRDDKKEIEGSDKEKGNLLSSERGEKTDNKNEDVETLSQIDAFVKAPLNIVTRSKQLDKTGESSFFLKKCQGDFNIKQVELSGEAIINQLLVEPNTKACSKRSSRNEVNQIEDIRNSAKASKKRQTELNVVDSKRRSLRGEPSRKEAESKSKLKDICEENYQDREDFQDAISPSRLKTNRATNGRQNANKKMGMEEIEIDHLENVSTSDSVKSDIEQSFALLEAKSRKTRKSRINTNVEEIKVAVSKNRESLVATVATPSTSGLTDIQPHTRKSRRITVNNNLLPAKQPKINQKSKHSSASVTQKGVDEPNSDSDCELPIKVAKVTNKPGKEGENMSSANISSSNRIESSKIKEPTTPARSRNSVRANKNKPLKINKSDTEDSNSSNDPTVSTPTRRGKNLPDESTLLNSAERSKRKQRPKVVFTMLDDPQLESLIRQLGGSVVDTVDACTVLVSQKIKRSQKLLTAVGQGKPICAPNWIRESKKANEFLDPWDFILTDREAETKWQFSLKESIMRAANEKLFANYTFQLMVNNASDVIKGAIEACGGKCVTKHPAKNLEGHFVIVASPENKSKYTKLKKQIAEIKIIEPEAIFDGVLRQEMRFSKHLLM